MNDETLNNEIDKELNGTLSKAGVSFSVLRKVNFTRVILCAVFIFVFCYISYIWWGFPIKDLMILSFVPAVVVTLLVYLILNRHFLVFISCFLFAFIMLATIIFLVFFFSVEQNPYVTFIVRAFTEK